MLHISKDELGKYNFKQAVKKPIPVNCVQINEPFTVNSLEGPVTGKAGDYLMQGVSGELYCCSKEIFEKSYTPLTLSENTTPKRILSLDGGGIKGALTLGYLKHIETLVRQKYDSHYSLCHYFNLIGGTSTGSIIAAGLAKGMHVDDIVKQYITLGKSIFGKKNLNTDIISALYKDEVLNTELKKAFGDMTLGSPELLTKLCIVAKRVDTRSTWYFHNNKRGPFFNDNKDIKLWQVIRASAAAPTYFVPQVICVDEKKQEYGTFVDGGISMANNPALGLLMVAALEGYGFKWPMGSNNLKLISVGTGYTKTADSYKKYQRASQIYWGKNMFAHFMEDANSHNQAILQWLSDSKGHEPIDLEMGNLENDYLPGGPLVDYNRYDFEFSFSKLKEIGMLKQVATQKRLESLSKMDEARNVDLLYEIGLKHAEQVIKLDDI